MFYNFTFAEFQLVFVHVCTLCLQIERDEVYLRRVIGAKKDSYYLDKKHVTLAPFLSVSLTGVSLYLNFVLIPR